MATSYISFFYLPAKKLRTQRVKKNRQKISGKPPRFIIFNACVHQSKQQPPTQLPDSSFSPKKYRKTILRGAWGNIYIYIRALHSPPKSICIKPLSPEHDTSGQDRNQERSHASNRSCHTAGPELCSLEPNLSHQIKARNGGSSSPKPHWSVCASFFPLLQTVTSSLLVWQLCLPSPAAHTQQNFSSGVSQRTESKASIPCLIRRDAAAWLGNGKEGTAPQADSSYSLKYVGRYLSLSLPGLSQKIYIHI